MAKKGQPGRGVYDELRNMPEHGICPFCGQRTISTLDHYLPKAHYPSFAVTPVNLVAACGDCNKEKSDRVIDSQEKQIIHPYYDDVSKIKWLCALVIEDSPVALQFYVQPCNSIDEVLKAKLQNHFSSLRLGVLYASHAGSELVNQKVMLVNLFDQGGASTVRKYLEEKANSYGKNHINSWQTVMYEALSTSDWFCERGLINI